MLAVVRRVLLLIPALLLQATTKRRKRIWSERGARELKKEVELKAEGEWNAAEAGELTVKTLKQSSKFNINRHQCYSMFLIT
jgi:hypothetical protein